MAGGSTVATSLVEVLGDVQSHLAGLLAVVVRIRDQRIVDTRMAVATHTVNPSRLLT